ncbi:MAG: 3-oxoacyl-[acyl-carrier-protein] reductase [Rickettsiales bacterium]|jgi:3-oxoacyl-[acyl-carrier protein] reductase|nr:3-oxoacyl-[acyl-carrier-protein] reductase [Rickettsiales bacterium]
MLDFRWQKVLVTGASGGIGEAVVRLFSRLGADVGLSARNADKMRELSKQLGGKSFIFSCDLENAEQTENLLEAADVEMGGVDVLVCNAGITKDGLSLRMSGEDFDKVLNVNLKSTFILNRNALKKMLKRKYGRIINISSVVGITGNAGQANYAASKAGLIAMTKSMAQETAQKNITMNCVAPGFIETAMTDVLTEEQRGKILAGIPAGRMGSPADVANAVCFLGSREAGYITGQTIHVNGGMLMV